MPWTSLHLRKIFIQGDEGQAWRCKSPAIFRWHYSAWFSCINHSEKYFPIKKWGGKTKSPVISYISHFHLPQNPAEYVSSPEEAGRLQHGHCLHRVLAVKVENPRRGAADEDSPAWRSPPQSYWDPSGREKHQVDDGGVGRAAKAVRTQNPWGPESCLVGHDFEQTRFSNYSVRLVFQILWKFGQEKRGRGLFL